MTASYPQLLYLEKRWRMKNHSYNIYLPRLKVPKHLSYIYDKYVVVHADKAPNNIAFFM
jgi:hypothetical protein